MIHPRISSCISWEYFEYILEILINCNFLRNVLGHNLSQKVGMSAHGTISITEYTQCEDVVVLVLNEFTRNNYCSFSLQKVKIRH